MLIRVNMSLTFNITNQAQAETLRDALVPFLQHAININEGQANEEIGFIQAEQCYHDQVPQQPCEILARWEVNRGRVI